MSGIKVNRSLVIEKTLEMDRQLKLAQEAAVRTREALAELFLAEIVLKGQGWDSVRSYVSEIQVPLNSLYINWTEIQMEGNGKYRREAGYLPVNDMDEDVFRNRIGEYRRKIKRERRRVHPNGSLIRFYERKIRMYEGFLDRLYTFVRRTEHVYDEASSLLRLAEDADTSIKEVRHEETLGGIVYAVTDRKWLNEVEKKNAEYRGEKYRKLAKREWKAYEIEEYWKRKDGYFEGHWWQDEEKLYEAYTCLRAEATMKGGFDVYEEGVAHNEENPSNKIYAVQAMFNCERSGYYDENLLNQLEIVMGSNGRDIHKMDMKLDAGAMDIGWKEYERILFKKSGNFLENNPYIADGINGMALAMVMMTGDFGQGNDESLSSAERAKQAERRNREPYAETERLQAGELEGVELEEVHAGDTGGTAKVEAPDKPSIRMGEGGTGSIGEGIESGSKANPTFATEDKLISHFEKHGGEFKGMFNTAEEYLQGAQDVMKNGYKVEYIYKGETRIGYVQFMGNNSKGNAKFAFVGTNNDGCITTFHTESGKTFWKMLNGKNIPIINPK